MKKIFAILLLLVMFLPIIDAFSEAIIELPESFTIIGGELDAYGLGHELVLNAKTSEEYRFIGYFLPAGIYCITNMNPKFPLQVSVYKNEIEKTDRWEEFAISDQHPVLIFAGDSKEISIGENEFIKISDGDVIAIEFISEIN